MPDKSNMWMLFAFLTVACWGLYGIFLHAGQVEMKDPVSGRYKAFFWVGIAYFLIAVLAPAGVLFAQGADWNMPGKGVWLSLVAVKHTAAGIAATIMATVPVLVLPLVIVFYRERVSPRAAAGAIVAVAGVALLFLA